MPKVDVLREQPVTPPVTGVTITLSLEEAQELAGILGTGSGLVGELYSELYDADAAIVAMSSAPYRAGMAWAEGQ